MNKKGATSILQIMILIVGTVAVAWALGGGLKIVSSAAVRTICTKSNPCTQDYLYGNRVTDTYYYKDDEGKWYTYSKGKEDSPVDIEYSSLQEMLNKLLEAKISACTKTNPCSGRDLFNEEASCLLCKYYQDESGTWVKTDSLGNTITLTPTQIDALNRAIGLEASSTNSQSSSSSNPLGAISAVAGAVSSAALPANSPKSGETSDESVTETASTKELCERRCPNANCRVDLSGNWRCYDEKMNEIIISSEGCARKCGNNYNFNSATYECVCGTQASGVSTSPDLAASLAKSGAIGAITLKLADGTTKTYENVKVLANADGTYNLVDKGGKIVKENIGNDIVSGPKTGLASIKDIGLGQFASAAGDALVWSLGTLGTIQIGLRLAGAVMPDIGEAEINYASVAAAGGMFVGKSLYNLKVLTKGQAIGAGIGVAALIFFLMYEDEKVEVVQFNCNSWSAPSGGAYCEECNKQGILPCSEYQCRSLGQGCQLLNPGTDEETCAWVNDKDVQYPTMQAWIDVLPDNFTYSPDKAISPPDRGVKIDYLSSADKCIPAFTPFEFGVTLDEPAECRVSYIREASFEDMDFYMGGSNLLKYNHSQMVSLPGPSTLASENITLTNGGEFSLFVRCKDANGNANVANFVFNYCVDEGPDTTAPLIMATEPLNNVPIKYNTSSMEMALYTNEPADCRWDHLDRSYNDMENSMTCTQKAMKINAQMTYKCTGELSGLKDMTENNFYFRCKDQPSAKEADRNANAESYKYTLYGTQPLVIDSVEPNGTIIKDSTDSIKVTLEVETSAGYKEGNSTCYYSETGKDGSYVMFLYETGTASYKHAQDLWLPAGDHTYYIKCVDLGGNADTAVIDFTTESDSEAPTVARLFHQDNYLKLITTENATCVYDTTSCNYLFEDGLNMTTVDGVEQYVEWKENTNFYIKCQDEFLNRPLPNQCSVIARPVKNY